jgi:hypothetical protein
VGLNALHPIPVEQTPAEGVGRICRWLLHASAVLRSGVGFACPRHCQAGEGCMSRHGSDRCGFCCCGRERCGGQGYLSVNRFGELIGFAHAGMTAEGDNR